MWSPIGSDQSVSENVFYLAPLTYIIEAMDEVITTLLTLCSLQASITARVPLTAGLISSLSFFGGFNGNGEAVCTTKSAP
jgi:hypothetical protein